MTIIDLNSRCPNYILKLKSGNFLFGADPGKLFHYSINEENLLSCSVEQFKHIVLSVLFVEKESPL